MDDFIVPKEVRIIKVDKDNFDVFIVYEDDTTKTMHVNGTKDILDYVDILMFTLRFKKKGKK